ncbi:magnesium-translocating P-type ATPase [bacterium SCN 62-11]|nr:magnesium-translocating P-type ATPase [Candidatus Eremiobacteraeota bacterium]ODT59463.1 MAG: magnesium-translocating P-type ATPase [bacterium SCN 62-11]
MTAFWLEAQPGPATGLTREEAEQRLREFGPNQIGGGRGPGALWLFLSTFANPLVLVLLGASFLSAALGEGGNALMIALIVMISCCLDFSQSFRSQRAAEKLRSSVATRAEVERDGRRQEIELEQVVPGDVLILSAGSIVAGDARLLSSKDLCTAEASLTGEALPVEKQAGELAEASLSEASNSVFLGTSVLNGMGRALVIHTGSSSQLGSVARSLTAGKGETDFERGTRAFGGLILRTTVSLVAFVFLTSLVFHRPPLQSLLFAVALAVGLTPEFLPMIVSVTLASGAGRLAGEKVVVKRLSALENLGAIDILCSDKTGTLTLGKIELERYVDLDGQECADVLRCAALNSAFQSGIRSPLDEAVLRHDHPAVEDHRKLEELPFDFNRRRLSVLLDGPEGPMLVTKGAPESVHPLCVTWGREGSLLDEAARARLQNTFEDLSRQGYRVLTIATGGAELREENLRLVGLAAFLDPPREDAAETLAELDRMGVKVKILTGDNDLVARKVCQEVGLAGQRCLLGRDLDALSDEALAVRAEETVLFARMSPAQKNRVITCLRARGHIVGYLGDGVNDAPALRNADIGISVDSAVDVAREAADIILLQPGLRPVQLGVLEGRRSFGNILKYVLMGTSSNFGNMFSMAGAALFLPFLPLLPAQLLLNTLLYDLSQLAIPKDYVDPHLLARPQRWNTAMIRRFMWTLGPLSSLFDFLTFAILLHVFRADPELFHSGWFVESLVTQVLVIFVIRTSGKPWSHPPHPALVVGAMLVVLAGCLIPAAGVLDFEPLPAAFYAYVLVASCLYLGLVQGVKKLLQ